MDYDAEGCPEDPPRVVQLPDHSMAAVSRLDVSDWDGMGRDVRAALQAAGLAHGRTTVRTLWVICATDLQALATTNLYDRYEKAAEDANELHDVLVVPLKIPSVEAGEGGLT